jgi:predicted phosphoribosyltransferase
MDTGISASKTDPTRVAATSNGDAAGTAIAHSRSVMDVMMYPQRRVGYADRREAGAALAERLRQFAGQDVVVLALPRGGVPVGYEVARALGAPLDVFVVRKLGLPVHPELAMGAIASGDVRVLNQDVLDSYPVPGAAIEAVTRVERLELERRERAYRDGRPLVPIEGRVVVLVDDGLATGSTMRAAVLAVRRLRPSRVVVAVPVGAWQTCQELRGIADDVVCAFIPEPFRAVGLWYADFSQTTDAEVRQLLALAASKSTTAGNGTRDA